MKLVNTWNAQLVKRPALYILIVFSRSFVWLLPLTLVACAPFANRLNEIPVAPYGDAWKLEVRDAQGKIVIAETFSRGSGSRRVELVKLENPSNGLSWVAESNLVSFQSSGLTLPKINLVYGAEVSEIKSPTLTGVALFVTAARTNNTSEIQTLYVYPNNQKGIYEQIGCAFPKLEAEQTAFKGYSFTTKPASNQLPLGSYMPAEFTSVGVCTLEKSSAKP